MTDTFVEDPALANLSAVRARMAAAADRSERPSEAIRLVMVTKTISASRLQRFLNVFPSDCRPCFGENRVQEALPKAVELSRVGRPDLSWSMIGHLQTNKVNNALAFASEIQSLDRISLAAELDRRLQRLGQARDVLVEVNTSGEDNKFGLPSEAVPSFLRELTVCNSLRVRGFMTIAVLSNEDALIRACFRKLRRLRDQMLNDAPQAAQLQELSMGMSADFESAIEEGATTVRIGQAIFGYRARQG